MPSASRVHHIRVRARLLAGEYLPPFAVPTQGLVELESMDVDGAHEDLATTARRMIADAEARWFADTTGQRR